MWEVRGWRSYKVRAIEGVKQLRDAPKRVDVTDDRAHILCLKEVNCLEEILHKGIGAGTHQGVSRGVSDGRVG